MTDQFPFNFLSVEEEEKLLLTRMEKCETSLESALLNLVSFYSQTRRQDIAFQYLDRLVAGTDDPEKKAAFFLEMGKLMEQLSNYSDASQFYRLALALEPVNKTVWYLINNNLGYCLIQLGDHAAACSYCRAAIQIDPSRHNAYKNLGLSLEGQGQYVEAAGQYIQAIQICPVDNRSVNHLGELFKKHPEIAADIPDIHDQIEAGWDAFALARKKDVQGKEKG